MISFLMRVFGRRRKEPERPLQSQVAVPVAADLAPISVRAMSNALRRAEPSSLLYGPRFTMSYADADGVCSERTVQLYAVPGRKASTFRAHCEMRNADRTFRIDRVEWISPDVGTRLEPAAYFAAMRSARDIAALSGSGR